MSLAMTNQNELIEKQRAWIDAICAKFKLTHTEMARKAKVAHTTVTRLFKPEVKNALSSTTMNKIAKYYNQPLLFEVGRVPLVGYVGAGGEVTLYAESQMQDTIEAPQEAVERGAEALIVKGNSMWPVYRDGDAIYYVRQCDFDNSYIGKDCVVELSNGQRLVKVLKRGVTHDTFTLDSYNQPPMEGVKIAWACPVKWVKKF